MRHIVAIVDVGIHFDEIKRSKEQSTHETLYAAQEAAKKLTRDINLENLEKSPLYIGDRVLIYPEYLKDSLVD